MASYLETAVLYAIPSFSDADQRRRDFPLEQAFVDELVWPVAHTGMLYCFRIRNHRQEYGLISTLKYMFLYFKQTSSV